MAIVGWQNVLIHPRRSRKPSNCIDSECFSSSMSIGQESENGDNISESTNGIENPSVMGSETEHEDNNSTISEQSCDLGELERERVRQVFKEWMNTVAKGHSSNRFRPGQQWLGENECERVRNIRKWIQTSVQQRNDCGSFGDEVAEVGPKTEKVYDSFVISHPEIGGRRPMRRICGRQILVDLLWIAQTERKRELLVLSERRPVSDFAHRNRIQALLRGRFLRNKRSIPDERPSSRGATELGLLRQRHTVSDLRNGFLSKLDNSAPTSGNTSESGSVSTEEINDELESKCREREATKIFTASDLKSTAEWQQKFVAQVSDEQYPYLGHEGRKREVLLDLDGDHIMEEPTSDTESSEQELLTDTICPGRRYGKQINGAINNDSLLETEDVLKICGWHEVFHDHCEARSDSSYVCEALGHTTELEGNANEEFNNLQNASVEMEEFQELIFGTEFTEWLDGGEENTDLHESPTSEWNHETSGNDAVEQESQEQWPTDNLQEAIDSCIDMPSGEVGLSVRRNYMFYCYDDDNAQSAEVRELFSRRFVSSLLQSSFRESLEQVLRSHVERHIHASADWELDSTTTTLVAEDEEQLNDDHQTLPISDISDRIRFTPASTIWDEDFQRTNSPNNINQRFATESDVTNDLRIDMARLQQRMNDMQSMLQACMEMQIELQHTVRQEHSAALNRSSLSSDSDASRDSFHDESKWNQVKNGICCICSDATIDSMLYRCGHMCTCSNCADNLVGHRGKCPMCRSPVVEVVRPSFLQ